MAKKYPSADEIRIALLPKNKSNKLMRIQYVKHKKTMKYKKSVKLKSKTKSTKKSVIFNLAGVAHHINTKAKLKQFRAGLDHGTELLIKHEFKNKFDENSCAIYFKKLKIGYVPKELSEYFIKKATEKKYFTFICCFNSVLVKLDKTTLFAYPIIAVPHN